MTHRPEDDGSHWFNFPEGYTSIQKFFSAVGLTVLALVSFAIVGFLIKLVVWAWFGIF